MYDIKIVGQGVAFDELCELLDQGLILGPDCGFDVGLIGVGCCADLLGGQWVGGC